MCVCVVVVVGGGGVVEEVMFTPADATTISKSVTVILLRPDTRGFVKEDNFLSFLHKNI